MHGWFEDGKTSPGPGGRVAGWPWGRGGRGAAGWGVWDEPRTIILTRILGCAEGDGGGAPERGVPEHVEAPGCAPLEF